ncbi:unnamed protein product [Rotaria sp. Silwood2]|nr:unnamed protein product [Rotaria sp. Silwood2]
MSKRKNKQTTVMADSGKKKFKYKSHQLIRAINMDRKSETHFEDLSTELIYEILEYLDAYDIYQSFFNLNMRFQNYLIGSTFLLKINISTLSKSQFHDYYKHFIAPNKHRIRLLNLSNIFVIDFFVFETEDISTYSQLQTLILRNIKPKSTQHLFTRLLSLPNLSSLTIHFDYDLDETNVFDLIFQLPVLKYCKISFSENARYSIKPISTNTSSSIEHLIIICKNFLFDLYDILSYVPQLRRLSIGCIHLPLPRRITDCSFALNNLTSVSLTLEQVEFDDLEQFIQSYFRKVQTLCISTTELSRLSDTKRWEKLFLLDMAYLRTFKLQIFWYQYTAHIGPDDGFILDELNSSFWSQQQWFFTQEYEFSFYKRYYGVVHSTFTDKSSLDKDVNGEKTIFDSVYHVIIEDATATTDGSKYSPNANQLTLSKYCCPRSKCFASDNLQYIIPWKQITKLNIDSNFFGFDDLVNMLLVMPNIDTLTYGSWTRLRDEGVSLERSERFQLVSKQNKIKSVTFECGYTLKTIKMLMNLCPQLEYLAIGTSRQSFEPTIAFLISKIKESNCHLSSLCIIGINNMWFEKLKVMIDSEKKTDEYSIKLVDSNCYLWL